MIELEPAIATAISHSFLAQVPADLVGRLLAGARLREIAAGQLFISTEEPHRCAIVVEGLARAYRLLPSGAAVTMRRVGPGAAVGVRAIVGRRNDLNVVGISHCVFLPLDSARLVALARDSAPLAWAIAEELNRRLDDTQLENESTVAGSVLQKTAGALLDMSIDGPALEVHMTQERFAELVGASREAVGRELRALAATKLITLERGRFIVRDALRLQSVARGRTSRRGTRHPGFQQK